MSVTDHGPDTQLESQPSAPPAEPGGRWSPAILFWCGLFLLFVGSMAIYTAWKSGREPTAGGSVAVPDGFNAPLLKRFTLTERSGREVRSEDLLGNVWVVNFFYSTCPNTCRLQTIKIAGMRREFGKAGVQFVSITCDPASDTPERLREYARQFEAPPEWLFLTGDMLYLRRIGAEMFQLYVGEKEHVDRLAVVDKWGNVRGRFNWHQDSEMSKLRALLPELLAEQQAPEEIVDANPPPRPPKPIDYAYPPEEVAPETLAR